ncbi:acylphosphatase [Chitinophaga sedimenti]|uniref:acylphosphatase n=1 Tax=Chitinophaga sedimenti TaxID=2033606 RepID=UPI0020032AE9|nr:acylphosphatase [Chitinophaga sedimenti]MCK7553899.1 acylphosphatase [Chitinophaga sedimenti]
MNILHREILVKGRVQGVYFRASAKSAADKLNVKGRVRNTPEGHVWIAAEATPGAMSAFIEWCKQGPPMANVTACEVTEGAPEHYTDFVIQR